MKVPYAASRGLVGEYYERGACIVTTVSSKTVPRSFAAIVRSDGLIEFRRSIFTECADAANSTDAALARAWQLFHLTGLSARAGRMCGQTTVPDSGASPEVVISAANMAALSGTYVVRR